MLSAVEVEHADAGDMPILRNGDDDVLRRSPAAALPGAPRRPSGHRRDRYPGNSGGYLTTLFPKSHTERFWRTGVRSCPSSRSYEGWILIWVVAASALPNYRLSVRFSDDAEGDVDLRDFIVEDSRPIVQSLGDVALFGARLHDNKVAVK